MKTGYIAIIGRPNVGKSTLLNSLISEKVSIVSDKPQTTRRRIMGIYNDDDSQIVFIDTPGIHSPKNKLNRFMVKEANEASDDVDCAVVVVEPRNPGKTEIQIIDRCKEKELPIILVINKTDKATHVQIAECITEYAKLADFASVIPVSALKNDGTEIILDEIKKLLDDGGEPFFPDDITTTETVRFLAAEILREKLMLRLNDEIPHGLATECMAFEESDGVSVCRINICIICEKEAHKKIIIGKNGSMIKAAATAARIEIERMLGEKVFLECYVKIKEDWRNDESFIKTANDIRD